MPTRKTSSTQRRAKRADFLLSAGTVTMRPCASCTSLGRICILSSHDERCEECFRHQRRCDLASPWAEVERLSKQSEKLQTEALEAEAKAVRLRRQRRLVLKKIKELDARERTNIEELEVDEMLAEASATVSGPEAPSSPTGFSQASFGSLLGRTSPLPSGNT
jgi:hypothetical protein